MAAPKVLLDDIDVSAWSDVADLQLENSDLQQNVTTATVALEEDPIRGAIPLTPANGRTLKIYQDGVNLDFYGRVSSLRREHVGTRLRYICPARNFATRALESTTGALSFAAPLTAPLGGPGLVGVLSGQHRYRYTFVNSLGQETAASPSSDPIVASGQQILVLQLSPGPAGTVSRNVYRTVDGGQAGSERFLATVADNTTTFLLDNAADGALGTTVPPAGTQWVDTDRTFVIAAWRAALQNTVADANGATSTDPIITANEAAGWPGVQSTAQLVGPNLAYLDLKSALDKLRTLAAGGPSWTVGADLIVNWKLQGQLAPFAVSDHPVPAGFAFIVRTPGYVEEDTLSGHFNKLTRGGAGGSTATAYDPVSIARYGVMEAPYKADPNVPAASLAQQTAAELATLLEKHVRKFRVDVKGLRAGMLVDVLDHKLGAGTAPYPVAATPMAALAGTSSSGTLSGERGRFLVQKVSVVRLGSDEYGYDVEVGDNVRDFVAKFLKVA